MQKFQIQHKVYKQYGGSQWRLSFKFQNYILCYLIINLLCQRQCFKTNACTNSLHNKDIANTAATAFIELTESSSFVESSGMFLTFRNFILYTEYFTPHFLTCVTLLFKKLNMVNLILHYQNGSLKFMILVNYISGIAQPIVLSFFLFENV